MHTHCVTHQARTRGALIINATRFLMRNREEMRERSFQDASSSARRIDGRTETRDSGMFRRMRRDAARRHNAASRRRRSELTRSGPCPRWGLMEDRKRTYKVRCPAIGHRTDEFSGNLSVPWPNVGRGQFSRWRTPKIARKPGEKFTVDYVDSSSH